jgi:hypothetical protein
MAFDFAEQDAKFKKAAAAEAVPAAGAAASSAKQSNPKAAKKRDVSSSKNANGSSTPEFGPSPMKEGKKQSPAAAAGFVFGSGPSVPMFGREPQFAFTSFGAATTATTPSTDGPHHSTLRLVPRELQMTIMSKTFGRKRVVRS